MTGPTSNVPEIIARHYEFLKWLMLRVAKFPRNQRYIFGKRVEEKNFDILEQLITAYYRKDKLAILNHINLDLEVVRYFLRLSNDLELLTHNQYKYSVTQLYEIGRQVGAWIKQQKST